LVNLQKLKDETSVLKLLPPMGMTNSEPACGRQAACDLLKTINIDT